ncbi:putative nucleoside transporter [Escherichia coli]|uniref:Putative nucleoside transporter n=1 Tax=Escherichia coli TaxID=562 RepID=A0A376L7J9_ECOLX|nr:putative nucleoside transporter [Escherichia coli]
MDVMRSVLGMVVLLAIAFLLSVNKKKISLRTVGAALVLQVVIGGIMHLVTARALGRRKSRFWRA